MAGNAGVIELVNQYIPILDAVYQKASVTSFLDAGPDMTRMTRNAKKILVPSITMDGLGDYSRTGGFTAGKSSLDWVEHEFTQDRGRRFDIDHEDNAESVGLAFGMLAGEFMRTKVVPELDAYRLATYASKAPSGNVVQDTLTDNETYGAFLAGLKALDDKEVPDEGRIAFVSTGFYYGLQKTTEATKYRDLVLTHRDLTVNGLNFKVDFINEVPILKVPTGRFKTVWDFKSGGTGEEEGGYVAGTGAVEIELLMMDRKAPLQISKRAISRIWAPDKSLVAGCDGVNPTLDAWGFDFRVYHDAFVTANKVDGIYLVKKEAV
jgi:hypothetical protein